VNPKSVAGMKQDRQGSGRNQGVKRLRKPEDAAQPGEANPVWVAARYLKRCRGRNPRRVRSFDGVLFSATRDGRTVRLGSNSEAERSP